MHLLLKEGGSFERLAPAVVVEEGKDADAEESAESGSTPEIIPLATRTKEGMAALVKVLQELPGVHTALVCVPAEIALGNPAAALCTSVVILWMTLPLLLHTTGRQA